MTRSSTWLLAGALSVSLLTSSPARAEKSHLDPAIGYNYGEIEPARTDAQVWRMVGVTPMLGQNDDGHTFDQADARQLVTFAGANHLGMLAFWETTRDRNACTGALYRCTNIAQAPYEFSRIFAGYAG